MRMSCKLTALTTFLHYFSLFQTFLIKFHDYYFSTPALYTVYPFIYVAYDYI